jgi:hypothetical protein
MIANVTKMNFWCAQNKVYANDTGDIRRQKTLGNASKMYNDPKGHLT